MKVGAVKAPTIWKLSMQTITTIGLDIAKSVFQVHGVDADGNIVIRRQVKRRYVLAFFQKQPPCLVGIEACASSHHWSRELQALGHTVRLMPPAYVKPYVDAEAICEAVTRANMRFVATKTPEQQSCLTLHRTRHLLIRQQTSVINAIRSHLAEFGVVAPVSPVSVRSWRLHLPASQIGWLQSSIGGKDRLGNICLTSASSRITRASRLGRVSFVRLCQLGCGLR